MKFRTIIFLSISGIVLGLLFASYLVVNFWTREQVALRTDAGLRSHFSTLRELNALRLDEAAKSCQIISETPRLKAVAELGDRNTIRQLAEELQQGARADLFMITDSTGKPLVQLVRGAPMPFPLPGIFSRTGGSVAVLDGMTLRLASAPLTVGPDTIGALTLGFAITEEELQSLRSMTGSEIFLLPAGSLSHSALTPSMQGELLAWYEGAARSRRPSPDSAAIIALPISGDVFKGCLLDLGPRGDAAAPASFLLLVSVSREVQSALEPVQNAFLVLSGAVLLITLAIGYLIARSITRPIADLVRGTAEISRGNYDVNIDIPKGVELKFLARQFSEMSVSLKEKIQQLAVRNEDLERALEKLRETQEELVKSERLAATGRLTAQLSHEINNPVHNILSCLQTALKRTPADAPERELLDVAHEEVERLARLTQQLLQVYRTSMAAPEQTVEVAINEIVRDVAAAYAPALDQRGIRIVSSLAEALPPIQATPDKLTQVFVNLLLNARDAMPDGGTITIATARHNGGVAATVADTGIGIPPENIHRVFDAFFTTKSKVSGVGLGLSVTYGIVQQFKGTISVRSAQGAGTTFTLTFPRSSQTP
jgi:signal transduction histidine kinase